MTFLAAFALLSASAINGQAAAVWLHSEIYSSAINATNQLPYLTQKLGSLNPVSSSSCGASSQSALCLVNIPSSISLTVPGSYSQLAPIIASPVVNNQLILSGNLVPQLNNANHTGYTAQLVFSSPGCSDLTTLTQVNFVPVFGNCVQWTTVGGIPYYTISQIGVASNGLPYATDSYCSDSQCSKNCLVGQTWALNSTCASVSGSYSYYLPTFVGVNGTTVTGLNQTIPTAPGTTAAPTPTGKASSSLPSVAMEGSNLIVSALLFLQYLL